MCIIIMSTLLYDSENIRLPETERERDKPSDFAQETVDTALHYIRVAYLDLALRKRVEGFLPEFFLC